MKTIEAYKTSDGTIFEDKKTAEAYDKKLIIDIELRNFLNRRLDYTETKAQNFSDDIMNNLEDFKRILNQ